MQKNNLHTYAIHKSGFTFSDPVGPDDHFTGSINIPETVPSGETLLCVTDFNLIIPCIVLSLANRLQKRFASTKYTVKNYKAVRLNRTITYSVNYFPVNGSSAKVKIRFFDDEILVAKFKGKQKVK